MSSSVQWNGATMGLPVFSSTGGAAGTTGATAAGGRSCAPRTAHANRSNTSFRIALKGYQTMALLFQTNSVSRRNIVGCLRRLPLKSPLRQAGALTLSPQTRPLYQTLGWLLVEHTFKERRAEVALGGIGQHRHNRFTGEFRQFAQPHRHRHRRTAGDAAQNALLFSQAARHLDGFLIGDQLHLVQHRQVQRVGNEPGADALDFVRAGRDGLAGQVLADDRTVLRLDADRQNLLAAVLLNVAGDTADGAAGADARNQHIDAGL